MIRYDVSFSLKGDVPENVGLARVEGFLIELRGRGLIHAFVITPIQDDQFTFRASVSFLDDAQFRAPFQEVERIGIHSGPHGFMIEGVEAFKVETERDME